MIESMILELVVRNNHSEARELIKLLFPEEVKRLRRAALVLVDLANKDIEQQAKMQAARQKDR